ncbi:hypothetical protein BJ878DRAFT_171482 [Calycina marina]|uniref:Uncharacterized protein n=1 Tax=Calycina marina TaxID=1763456 RepID=A0A9P7Z8F7_9HELO|nr:hypothetical protein BJ878DRAFT_171482 [Calycina marina]
MLLWISTDDGLLPVAGLSAAGYPALYSDTRCSTKDHIGYPVSSIYSSRSGYVFVHVRAMKCSLYFCGVENPNISRASTTILPPPHVYTTTAISIVTIDEIRVQTISTTHFDNDKQRSWEYNHDHCDDAIHCHCAGCGIRLAMTQAEAEELGNVVEIMDTSMRSFARPTTFQAPRSTRLDFAAQPSLENLSLDQRFHKRSVAQPSYRYNLWLSEYV